MISGLQKTFDAGMIFCSRPESYTCRQTQTYSKEWPWKALCLVMRAGQPQNLNLSPEIHLNDFAFHFHREQTQSINYVWLKTRRRNSLINKKNKTKKIAISIWIVPIISFHPPCECVGVCVFLLTATPDCWGHQIFQLLETQSYFDSKNWKKDRERDRTRQREKEVHV